jgi:hypothetical protein
MKTVVSSVFKLWSKNNLKNKPAADATSFLANTKGAGLGHFQLGKLTAQYVRSPSFWRDLDDRLPHNCGRAVQGTSGY